MTQTEKQKVNVVCPCKGVTEDDLKRIIRANPGMNFDGLLQVTAAGSKCTACLLDLEYYYVSGEVPPSSTRQKRHSRPKKSFKRRVYDFIDYFSPHRCVVSRSVAPVVSGCNIEQYICLANFPILFEEASRDAAAPHMARIIVRERTGQQVFEELVDLRVGSAVKLNISEPLKARASEERPFEIGTVDVELWSAVPGHRGTTRPQIEIVTDRASCAVHTQGIEKGPYQAGLTCAARPADDRLYVIGMNASAEPMQFTTRVGPVGQRLIEAGCFEVDSGGACLFEVPTEKYVSGNKSDVFLDVAVSATPGGSRAYILCSTRNHDRFSVDHL